MHDFTISFTLPVAAPARTFSHCLAAGQHVDVIQPRKTRLQLITSLHFSFSHRIAFEPVRPVSVSSIVRIIACSMHSSLSLSSIIIISVQQTHSYFTTHRRLHNLCPPSARPPTIREQLSPLQPANEHLALSATTTGRAHACPAIGHHIQLRAPCPYLVFPPPFVSQSRWFSCLPSFFSLFFLARLAYANYIPCRAVPYSLLRRYNNPYTYVHLCLPSVRSPHSLYTAPCAPRRACAFPSPKERTN